MPVNTKTFSHGGVRPIMNDGNSAASQIVATFPVSVTYAAGTLLGPVTATPGQYAAYATGNLNGTQYPQAVLQYAVTTDASGNITNYDEWGGTAKGAPVWTQGVFLLSHLVTPDVTGFQAGKGGLRVLSGDAATAATCFIGIGV